jgi:hypothetical protein
MGAIAVPSGIDPAPGEEHDEDAVAPRCRLTRTHLKARTDEIEFRNEEYIGRNDPGPKPSEAHGNLTGVTKKFAIFRGKSPPENRVPLL